MKRQSRKLPQSPRNQRGVTTLLIALVILVILTVVILSSSSVALFEQKTATNENRQRLADQAAQYGLNLGGEFLKANIVDLASAEVNGWLAGGTKHWVKCIDATGWPSGLAANHPCRSEPSQARAAEMYYYTQDGTTSVAGTNATLPFDSWIPTGAGVAPMGGAFTATTQVSALLCLLDTTIQSGGVSAPACRLDPDPKSSNRIAITLISTAGLATENAASEMKETWANFDTFATASAAPLVASGAIDGTGNVEIVTAPNGGGTGIPVSIWSASDADVDKTAGGSAASISSCQLGEFLKSTPIDTYKTVCPASNTACGCPAVQNASSPEEAYAVNPNFLSGKIPGSSPACCENLDILDRDSNKGVNPDIQFFPGRGLDNFTVNDDDSLFEWIFRVSNEANTTRPDATTVGSGQGPTLTNCGPSSDQNCAIFDLTDPNTLGATSVTCAQLTALGSAASGLYYVSDSSAGNQCDMPGQVGTPTSPAIVVVNGAARLNNTLFYGMLFIRSDDDTATFRGNGHSEVYGSVVVEGSADITGGLRLVYDDTGLGGPKKKLAENTRLGRVPGSWLDTRAGGF
jgi:Tfp pilus assembly protein PilX